MPVLLGRPAQRGHRQPVHAGDDRDRSEGPGIAGEGDHQVLSFGVRRRNRQPWPIHQGKEVAWYKNTPNAFDYFCGTPPDSYPAPSSRSAWLRSVRNRQGSSSSAVRRQRVTSSTVRSAADMVTHEPSSGSALPGQEREQIRFRIGGFQISTQYLVLSTQYSVLLNREIPTLAPAISDLTGLWHDLPQTGRRR